MIVLYLLQSGVVVLKEDGNGLAIKSVKGKIPRGVISQELSKALDQRGHFLDRFFLR